MTRRRGRRSLIAGLYLAGTLNGLAVHVVTSVASEPVWSAIVGTFGISVVAVAALVCGMVLVRRVPDREIDRLDVLLAVFLSLLILVPHRAGSWTAVTILALFELSGSRSTAENRAAAAIFLVLAASELWARVIVQASGNLLLSWDAALVTLVLSQFVAGEVIRTANLIVMPDGSSLALIIGCDSLTNVTYALLCWLTIARSLRPGWGGSDLTAAIVVVGSGAALNTLRVALMGLGSENYALVHGPVGADVFNVVLLILSGGIALCTNARGLRPSRVSSPSPS